ncbi:MAG TPA: hypothetical protein DEP18_05490 [Flavobacteriales bacterium]|nr:hypothetical protein [Flavobacteriales bacterium]HRE75570.1 hypothetical protein [Flavobacteriales bacterium]HRJ38677.1 hypothetical protein [Flavobacteriales bacterium]
MIKQLFFLTCLFLIVFPGRSQMREVARVENKYRQGADYMFLNRENGIVLGGLVFAEDKKPMTYAFKHYNTDLKLTDSVVFEVPMGFALFGNRKIEDDIYFVFSTYNKTPVYIIARYRIPEKKVELKRGTLPKSYLIIEVASLKDKLFFRGGSRRDQQLLQYDFESNTLKTIPLPGNVQDAKFLFYVPDGSSSILHVALSAGKGKGFKFYSHFFNENGEFAKKSQRVIEEPGYYCRTASMTELSENEYILVGTYSKGKAVTTNGVYFARYENDNQVVNKRYSFSDFPEFSKKVGDGRTGFNNWGNVERQTNRKTQKGKTDFLEANVLIHSLFKFQGNYVYIIECYYPTFRTEYSSMTNQNASTARSVFDGNVFTHALVLGLDHLGNVVYDFTFDLPKKLLKDYQARRQLGSIRKDDAVDIYFKYPKDLECMRLSNNQLTEIKKVRTDSDSLDAVYSAKSQHWYGDYYIRYEMIKRLIPGEKKKEETIFETVKYKKEIHN